MRFSPCRPLLVWFVFACAAALAAPARAGLPPTEAQMILRRASSPADLRAQLMAYATGHAKDAPIVAGEAWHFCGESYSRAGKADSAMVAWRNAVSLRGGLPEIEALAEALLQRGESGDPDRALALLQGPLAEARAQSDPAATRLQLLTAWGELRAGRVDRARELFADVLPAVGRSDRWRHRYAEVQLAAHDPIGVIQTLRPIAVRSRGQHAGVIQLMQAAADQMGQGSALENDLIERLSKRDAIEQRAIERMEGRRIRFAASDSFPLSGVALVPPGGRPKPAIVMMSVVDTVAEYDSLVVALKRGGFAVLLLDARGSGWATAASCPIPDAWRGREEEMQRRAARDAREAVRALAAITRLDTSAVLLVASGNMALPAAQAAVQDRRVRALVLLSPDPHPVDRGVLPATLARRRMPVFFQQTPEDFPNFEFTELALHAADEPRSRVSDGRAAGSGAVAFRQDARVAPRFSQWLKEAMTGPPPPPATPPAPRRKG